MRSVGPDCFWVTARFCFCCCWAKASVETDALTRIAKTPVIASAKTRVRILLSSCAVAAQDIEPSRIVLVKVVQQQVDLGRLPAQARRQHQRPVSRPVPRPAEGGVIGPADAMLQS
jgi:hypothetical protein